MRLLLSILLSSCLCSAATINIADYGDGSGSSTNFNSAYAAASEGDTIAFPTGTNTWVNGVTVGKRVNIFGQGTNSTKLVAGGTMAAPFFTITGFSTTNRMRISGIKFDLVNVTTSGRQAIYSHTVSNYYFRLDNCEFHHGALVLEMGGTKGVIDHNTWYNPLQNLFTAGVNAQATASWESMAAGTGDALFIEDNNFIYDAGYLGAYYQETIGSYNGGKLVIRNNFWDSTNTPATDTMVPIELHGSAAGGVANGYWQQGTGARRGQSVVEIYNNSIGGKRIDYMMFRGSALLIYSNTIEGGTYAPVVKFMEEEGFDAGWSPLRTAWPAEDQVHNTHVWGNTFTIGGVASTNYVDIGAASTNFIQLNRDYWLSAPASSGGYEYFTDANGASGTHPTDGDPYPTEGTMVFTNTGANYYYGYTPYTYPHPLADETGPVITNVVSTPNSISTVTVTWTLDESCTNAVYCSEDESWTNSVSSATFTTSPSLQLTGLKTATTYNVYVFSQDAYGNSSTNRAADFTTLDEPTDPTITRVTIGGGMTFSGGVEIKGN